MTKKSSESQGGRGPEESGHSRTAPGADESGGRPVRIFTVGHSTREAGEFLAILQAHGIARLIDVRTIPRSARNPQFNRETLPDTLRTVGISYEHRPELGGLRHSRPDSINTAWKNTSFRGYADYMQTPEFEAAIGRLIETAGAGAGPLAIMCAEAVPWRCHRSLISDALQVRGVDVRHIMSPTQAQPHRLTSFAHVEGTRITYPAEQPLL